MWTDEHREIYKRAGGRFPSDMADDEWAVLEPLIPPASSGGRPHQTDMREAMCETDAVGYDAAKKLKGRKIHALGDTEGLPLRVIVHSAGLQSLPRRRPGTATAQP